MIGKSDRVWLRVQTSDSLSFSLYTSKIPRVGEFFIHERRTYEVTKITYDINDDVVFVKAALCD